MENLVPLGTGNSRLMKSNISSNTTLAQLIQMWNNGTFPYDIGPLNSAGISQQGTPLNKDALLKDTTAALYGLGTDAVPDDVLQKIPSLFNDYKKIEVGQYIGTGSTAGSITVNIDPILLIIYGFPQYDSSYIRYSYGLSIMPCGAPVFTGSVSTSKDTYVCFNRGAFIQTDTNMIKGTSSRNIKWRYDGTHNSVNEIAMNEKSSIYHYICLGA